MFVLMLVLTLGISIWNAYVSGKQWPYARLLGGFSKLAAISGLVVSGIGFSMVYLVVIAFVGVAFHLLGQGVLTAIGALYPAFIILPLVMFGLVITIESWRAVFAKGQSGLERVANMAVAVSNTFSSAENIVETPAILEKAMSFLVSDDDADVTSISLGLIVMALCSGGITGWVIFRRGAATATFKLRKMA